MIHRKEDDSLENEPLEELEFSVMDKNTMPLPQNSKKPLALRRLDHSRARLSIEYQLIYHQVRRNRLLLLDAIQCFLALIQVLAATFEYSLFFSPKSPASSVGYYTSKDQCEQLRILILLLNLVLILLSGMHFHSCYRSAVFEGVEYMYELKAQDFTTTKYFVFLMLEVVVLVPMVPPTELYDLRELSFHTFWWGQGFGSFDVKYSLNGFILLYFVTIRLIVTARILTRLSKYRSFRAESTLKSFEITGRWRTFSFAMKAIFKKYNFYLVLYALFIAVSWLSVANIVTDQPYYINRDFYNWNAFQDYNSVFPVGVASVQVLTQNVVRGSFMPRTVAGLFAGAAGNIASILFISLTFNSLKNLCEVSIAQRRTQYMLQNEETRTRLYK